MYVKNHKNKKMVIGISILAILLSIIGQFLLSNGLLLISALLYVLSTFLIVYSISRETPRSSFSMQETKKLVFSKTPIGYLILGGSVVFSILSFSLFETEVQQIFPWLIHIVSIIFFLLSITYLQKNNQGSIDDSGFWKSSEIYIFLLLILFGGIVRFSNLDNIPFGLWYDEADFGLKAIKIISDPGYFPVFFSDIRVSSYFIYLIAFSFKIFGISVASIRYASAFFGIATIIAAYFCGKELFNRKTGLLLAFFIAFSRWDINWSRIGLDNITTPFFEFLVIALLHRAFRKMQVMDFALAGLSLGFGLCFYASMRIFPFVIGIWLIAKWISKKDFFASSWRGLIFFVIAIIISSIPITQYAIKNSEVFWSRVNETSIFNGKTTIEGWNAVAENTREHLLMFNYKGDQNGRHNLPGEPMMDPITGALMVLGLGISISRIRKQKYFLFITWFLLSLVPGIFSLDFESPQSLRAIGSLPVVFLLATIPIQEVWKLIENEYEKNIKNAVTVIMVLIFGFSMVYNLSLYFTYQVNSSNSWVEFSTRETIIGKKMAEFGEEANYYLSTFYHNAPTIQFLAPKINNSKKLETYDIFPLDNISGKNDIFFLDPEREPFFNLGKKYFPNAEFTKIKDPNGTTILLQMQIKPSDFQANQGLKASYYRNLDFSGYPFVVEQQKYFQYNWEEISEGNFPFAVKFDGILYADQFGEYSFSFNSSENSKLFIDGEQVKLNQAGGNNYPIILAKGNHNIQIQTIANGGNFEILWQPPQGDLQPLLAKSLYVDPVSANGLLGQYYASPDWSGAVTYAQIDPFINFYYHNSPLPRPYTVEWQGKIKIPKDGNYAFGLQSIDESQLFIDDAMLINNESKDTYLETIQFLTAGYHLIRVRYADRTGYTFIKLFWTPPSGETVIIPQEVLFHP